MHALRQEDQQPAVASTSHAAPASTGDAPQKCVIIYENTPAPSLMGRFSFNACNPAFEKSKTPAQAKGAAASPSAASQGAKRKDVEESTVTDADMAKAFMRGPSAAAATPKEETLSSKQKKSRTNPY